MRYEGTVYRPPSEVGSLIIQLTIGGARNTCTFCNMYKDKKFRIRPLEEVAEDLEMARKYYSHIKVRRIFLADGDALIVKTKDLLYILDKCHEYFPEVERISVYGAPKDILGKTPEELKQLKDAGLDMVYMGLESGDDDVLKEVKKGVTSEEMIAAGIKVREAGMILSMTIISGLGGKVNGVPREDSFQITVASEIMAIFCLANDLHDLKEMLGKIIVGYTYDDEPVTAKQIGADGAMTVLLKDALQPNLVQTLEHTPAFIHGGPFANIAHGCNSVRATKFAMKLADYVVTEAGFGADLGAEKFFDIKCRKAGLKPDAVVLVATVRALKYNGGVPKADLSNENLDALAKGFVNLEKHIENIQKYGVPVVVTLNHFVADTDAEVAYVKERCEKMGATFAVAKVWADGGEGGKALAEKVLETLETKESNFHVLYEDNLSIEEKINKVCKEIYGAGHVSFTAAAKKTLAQIEKLGFEHFPVCIAKTQYSLSDDPKVLGRPEGFEVTVKEIRISAGAGFIVALLGDVMTMPGLPKKPAALNIDIDADGNIVGLF